MFHLQHEQPATPTPLQVAAQEMLAAMSDYSSLMMLLMVLRRGLATITIDDEELSRSRTTKFVEDNANRGLSSLGTVLKLTHPLIGLSPDTVRAFALETAADIAEWAVFAWNVVEGEYDDDRLIRSALARKHSLEDGRTDYTLPPLTAWRVPDADALADWRANEFRLRNRLAILSYHEDISVKKETAGTLDLVPPDLVTLEAAAAIVHRSKRTLEKHLGRMPRPYIQGGGGKPNLWKWAELRPWLQDNFVPELPEVFPGSRRAKLAEADRS